MSGYYPRGKLNESDEGAALISIDVQDKTVIINFGKECSWIGMDKFAAIELAKILTEQANSIEVSD